MQKTIIIIIIALVVGYVIGAKSWNQKVVSYGDNGTNAKTDDQYSIDSFKQERLLIYREECQNDWDRKVATVEDFVQSSPSITGEQAKNIAVRAGIADQDGYIIDDDIWVKDCIDKKVEIFE